MSGALYLTACCVLGYSGFCRLVHTSLTTELCIRLAFWAMTTAAICNAATVLLWGYEPGWPAALLVSAMATVQVATSVLWRRGVPDDYKRQP